MDLFLIAMMASAFCLGWMFALLMQLREIGKRDRPLTMTERTYGNCPECDYSATPNEHLGRERKHHWPHWLECVRCGYQTETKGTWPEAIAAWNKKAASHGEGGNTNAVD